VLGDESVAALNGSAVGGPDLPAISIVMPSYNQARFLPFALDSVLDQGYPGLECVVIDGGSDDGSADIIAARGDRVAFWSSEKDRGQYHAINKGFARTSGEVMGWLNSDDLYLPKALWVVGEIFAAFPEVQWLTTQYQITWDENGAARECQRIRGYGRQAVLRGVYLTGGSWYSVGVIQQESTFWRRSLWERAGARVDDTMRYAADFDLWLRFARFADPCAVAVPLGGFRRHGAQKTAASGVAEYFREARRALLAHGGRPSSFAMTSRRRVLDRLSGGGRAPRPVSPLSRVLLGGAAAYTARTVIWQDGRWRLRAERLV
jgi:glycosyltransferase involved in cell wall biosynthesis